MDLRNDPDDSPPKCVTDKCERVPSVSFLWPGRERTPACAFCGARAQTIASAMGFTLELTELPAPRVNPWDALAHEMIVNAADTVVRVMGERIERLEVQVRLNLRECRGARGVDVGENPDAVVDVVGSSPVEPDRGNPCKWCRHYDDEHCPCGRGCLGKDSPSAGQCDCGGYQ